MKKLSNNIIKTVQKVLKKNKIRNKLLAYFFLIIVLMSLTSIYTYVNARMSMDVIGKMFENNIYLNQLDDNISNTEMFLEDYLNTKTSKSLEKYMHYRDILKSQVKEIEKTSISTESGILLHTIGGMIETYISETDKAIKSKNEGNIAEYTIHYSNASKFMRYINTNINELNMIHLKENNADYRATLDRLNLGLVLNIAIIIFLVIINTAITLWITSKISSPLVSLSEAAYKISRGNFEVDDIIVDTDDEISVLANAFNRMKVGMKNYINEIKMNAELENKIKEHEMNNLVMKNLLKDAELQALQSQINPHFIFNTLNAGAQLAMLEGANKACTFNENVAELLRYNLRKLDTPAMLSEEIDNVNRYIYILKIRFTDRIEYTQEIDENIGDIKVPRMILQPLIENAYIHRISDYEDGGKISLFVKRREKEVEIVVEDNGKGIEEEKLKLIAEGKEKSNVSHGHTTGIGLNNVIHRLKVFFGREDVFSIYSSPGKGTKVVIRIPMKD